MERYQNDRCCLVPTAESLFGEQLNVIQRPPFGAGSGLVTSPCGDPGGLVFRHSGTQLKASLFFPAAFSAAPTRAPSNHNEMIYLNCGCLVREQIEMLFSSMCTDGERRERYRGSWHFSIIYCLQ